MTSGYDSGADRPKRMTRFWPWQTRSFTGNVLIMQLKNIHVPLDWIEILLETWFLGGKGFDIS